MYSAKKKKKRKKKEGKGIKSDRYATLYMYIYICVYTVHGNDEDVRQHGTPLLSFQKITRGNIDGTRLEFCASGVW